MTTMRWMKGLVLAACLGTAVNSWGYVNDRVWNATTATNWNTAANWSGSAVPGATDRASFNNNAAGATVNLDINPTVSDFQFQTWNGLTVNNPAALLTVTNTFVFYGGSTVNFYPTLAVSNGVLTQRYSYDNRANLLWFYNFGNTFAGGIDTFIHSVVIDKNAGTNLFSGVIRAAGFCDLNGNTQGNQPGSVQIMSASNTFGVGRFELNRGGHIAIIQSADFSNITNIFFNGGMLHLGNIRTRATNNFPAYANGIQVSQGTLECYNDASLGTNTPFNRIVLGSSGHFGVLQGESENASGKYIAHPIVLNGNGGIINASSYGSGNNFSMTFLTDLGNIYHQYLNSLISGSGDLITKGSANVYINNGGYASFTPNTYTGQTRIVNNATDVGTLRSLGTGNVIVDNGATLLLRSSNAVATTATLYVGRSGTGKVFDPAVLKLYYTSGGGIPNLDANSTGILSLNAGNTDAAANNRLKTLLSNTTIFLGYIGDGYDKSTITATNLGVGAGGVYRIAGAGFYPSDYMVLDAPGTTGVLTGPNSLEVGLPYDEWVSYYAGGAPNYHGRLQLKDANDYTGTTTVHLAATLWGDAQTNANTSPFGSTTATVVLNGGTLILNGTTNSVAVSKGALTVQGSGKLAVDDKSSVNQVADITVDSFVRTNHSTLVVYGPNHFGSSERVKIASAPTPANGMVAPYMIGTNAFLNYLGATGFTNAVFTATVGGASFNSGLSAGTDVVNVTATTTLQDNPYIYALRAAAAVTSNGAGKDTVTLGSGGLILNGASYTINPNLAFGTVSGSTTNPVEGVIYAQDSTLDARGRNSSSSTAPLLSGQITAAALTKTGPGYARLSGNNAGTLTGPITINEGGLLIAGWTNLGSSANDVVLNGGHLDATATAAITNAIKIGPLGGILNIKDSNALKTYGGISDLEAGNSGPLRLLGNRIYGTNTYSGGTIIEATMSDDANTAPAPSFGTGPVRIRGGYMYSFLCGAAFVHPARWTLQDGGSGIEIANQPVTLGSLEGCGNVVFGDLYGIYTPANGWTLTVGGDNSDSDYYGIIYELPYRGASNANTPGNLVKLGSGVFTIWGDSTYHGTTVVSNGTLTVNGALCFTTNVTVYSGAVLTGKGTVGGAVTVNGTGRLGGTLFFQSNVTLNASAFVDVTVNGANAFNQLTLQGGTLDLNGATLNLTLGFKPTVGQLFTIANTMGGAVSHQFAQAGTIAASYNGKPYTFRISYTGGNVVLTAMPNGTVISIR